MPRDCGHCFHLPRHGKHASYMDEHLAGVTIQEFQWAAALDAGRARVAACRGCGQVGGWGRHGREDVGVGAGVRWWQRCHSV